LVRSDVDDATRIFAGVDELPYLLLDLDRLPDAPRAAQQVEPARGQIFKNCGRVLERSFSGPSEVRIAEDPGPGLSPPARVSQNLSEFRCGRQLGDSGCGYGRVGEGYQKLGVESRWWRSDMSFMAGYVYNNRRNVQNKSYIMRIATAQRYYRPVLVPAGNMPVYRAPERSASRTGLAWRPQLPYDLGRREARHR